VNDKTPKPGDSVVLKEIPPGLLDDLPEEDQQAITAIVGKPVILEEYDEDGRAALMFRSADGSYHTIYVSPSFVRGA
jgi:hypothetical protein